MSRTLLVLALVALLFAGVVLADDSSSSSTGGDMTSSTSNPSSTVQGSSTAGSSSTSNPSSTVQGSSTAGSSSTSNPSSTVQGSSTAGSSSTGNKGNTTSSSTGSAASSTGVAPVTPTTANVTVALRFSQLLNTTAQQTGACSALSSLLGFNGATCASVTLTSTTGRRLLATGNVYNFVYNNIPVATANAASSKITQAGLTSALSTYGVDNTYAAIGQNGAAPTNITPTPPSSAAALAASPLVLAALAAFAMLF